MRVKGFYLAITTIAAQFIIIWVINHWSSVTGGFVGIKVPYASIGGYEFRSEASQFYLIMTIAVLCTFFAKNLARTRVGRAFIAIRDNDLAAEVMGINLLLLGAEVFKELYTDSWHKAPIVYLFVGLHGHTGLVKWIWMPWLSMF